MKTTKGLAFSIMLALGVVCGIPQSWAKKPEHVDIKVGLVQVWVNNGRIVRGSPRTTMEVKRSQGNPCTKVRYIRVVKGLDEKSVRDELALIKVSDRRRGLCNFTRRFEIQPWSEQELVHACQGRNAGGIFAKREHARVTFWKTKPEKQHWVQTGTRRECHQERYCYASVGKKCYDWRWRQVCKDVPTGHQAPCDRICQGDKIRLIRGRQYPDHDTFVEAKVYCQRRMAPITAPAPKDMSGWWKFSTSFSSNAEGFWKFSSGGWVNRMTRRFDTAGIAQRIPVMVSQGGGIATLTSGNEFRWSPRVRTQAGVVTIECRGTLDPGTMEVTGQCNRPRGFDMRVPPFGTFTLTRAAPPPQVHKPPIGRPTVPGHQGPQIKNKPTFNPGFKPGPPLPKPGPHW